MKLLQQAYESVPPKARKRIQYWSIFQNLLAYYRYKCPVHPVNGGIKASELKRLLQEYEETIEKAGKQNLKAYKSYSGPIRS